MHALDSHALFSKLERGLTLHKSFEAKSNIKLPPYNIKKINFMGDSFGWDCVIIRQVVVLIWNISGGAMSSN